MDEETEDTEEEEIQEMGIEEKKNSEEEDVRWLWNFILRNQVKEIIEDDLFRFLQWFIGTRVVSDFPAYAGLFNRRILALTYMKLRIYDGPRLSYWNVYKKKDKKNMCEREIKNFFHDFSMI